MTPRALTRRQALGLLGAATATLLVGCEPASEAARWLRRFFGYRPEVASFPPCIVRPEQMEGPYFADARLNRSDIRADTSDGSVKEGVPLELAIRVHDIRGQQCLPLPNVMVDLWHCDAAGVYSDVRDRAFDTTGKTFLRGYQMTDAEGVARFRTIVPGWYPGRAVHIHFKIRTTPQDRGGYDFTSQLYFDDAATRHILARPPYADPSRGWRRNSEDWIYRRGGKSLILELSPSGAGFAGTFDIGLLLD